MFFSLQAKYDAKQTSKHTLLPFSSRSSLNQSNGYAFYPQRNGLYADSSNGTIGNGAVTNGLNNNKLFESKLKPVNGNLLFL